MNNLHIVHININGLRGRKTELEVYLNETLPDVICLNETKLEAASPPNLIGYNIACNKERSSDGGRGVIIYIKNNLIHEDISPDIEDLVATLISLPGGKLAVIAHYCPPDKDSIDTQALNYYFNKYPNTVVTGDLNSKHTYFGCTKTDRKGDILFNLVEENDAHVANNPEEPTRYDLKRGTAELLDYIIVSKNLSGKIMCCHTGDDIGSDHRPLHLQLSVLKSPSNHSNKRLVRPLKKCDWNCFSDALHQADPILSDYSNPLSVDSLDIKAQAFEEIILSAFDKACPLVEVKHQGPVISSEALALIREKRKARRLAQRDLFYVPVYQSLEKQVKQMISKEKAVSWQTAIESLNYTDGSEFWKNIQTSNWHWQK